jgi:beta-1,2-mannobiose phosphorylase / 1,2-beta-oligomannan phosphorylase
MTDLSTRFKTNPILKPSDVKPSEEGLMVECLLNPGVFTFEGKTHLLLRVAERPEQKDDQVILPVLRDGKTEILYFDKNDPDLNTEDPRGITYKGKDYLTTLSHLRLASSSDGENFEVTDVNLVGEGRYETFGIEDCRVCEVEGTFYLLYTAVSENGHGIGMRSTTDWKNFTHHGIIIPPANKDGALIEEKVKGEYWCIHRPTGVGLGANSMWIARSPDMVHWGQHEMLAAPRRGMWDSVRVGAGTSPIKTDYGWLEIYHGANEKNRYCLGAMLLDLENPSKVLARSEEPIMEPATDYEKFGFFGEVLFTNGHVVEGDTVKMYYGASDDVICGATFSIEEILKSLGVLQPAAVSS